MTVTAAGMKGDDSPPPSASAPPHIPFVLLVEEILCRLPVKYLLELRCVCKSWNSLISGDSKFAKKQFHFSTFCHDRHHLAVSPYLTPQEFHLCDSPISSFFSSSSVASSSITSFTQLNHPAILNFERKDILERISTCHGIICFRIDASLALLFNPSTKKFNFLPPMKKPAQQNHFTLVYDRLSDNHKIIALSVLTSRVELNVHTLGTDYWRKIQDFPYYNIYHKIGIFVSGTVNWLVSGGYSKSRLPRVIIYFDLETELCQEFTYPLSDETLGTYQCLGALKDCLCIFFHNEQFSDIWIMKEYGNEKSWSKLLRIPYIGDPTFYWINTPLYIYEDDQVLVKFLKKSQFSLAVYDSKKNTFKVLEIQGNIDSSFMTEVVYVESLISP